MRQSANQHPERLDVIRDAVGAVAPLLPLVLVAIVVMPPLLAGHPLPVVEARLGVVLLLALLGGAVLSRLEMAEVVRNLERRVAERTLDLGTRERWFRALVQNASDVVTVVDGDLIVRYQTPSAVAHARPRARRPRRCSRSTRCSSRRAVPGCAKPWPRRSADRECRSPWTCRSLTPRATC